MRLSWIVAGVLVLDQITKVWVRTTMGMAPRRSIDLIGDWLKFTYTENPGIAFGITFGPDGLLTGVSIIATGLVAYYLYTVRAGYLPYTVCLACILGGAIGNIIDRLVYGLIFGYAGFFQGRVVDFIHINLWTGRVPAEVPFLGGMHLSILPIFNVADIGIVGGVIGILVFQNAFHARQLELEPAAEPPIPKESA